MNCHSLGGNGTSFSLGSPWLWGGAFQDLALLLAKLSKWDKQIDLKDVKVLSPSGSPAEVKEKVLNAQTVKRSNYAVCAFPLHKHQRLIKPSWSLGARTLAWTLGPEGPFRSQPGHLWAVWPLADGTNRGACSIAILWWLKAGKMCMQSVWALNNPINFHYSLSTGATGNFQAVSQVMSHSSNHPAVSPYIETQC